MTPGAIIEACARAAHEANRAYCIALGDTSQPPWDDAPKWQRDSAKLGVFGALKGATPEQSHEGWCELKRREGWMYGPSKDPERKTHPCLVPYADLPEAQRRKDEIFLSVVRAVTSAFEGR